MDESKDEPRDSNIPQGSLGTGKLAVLPLIQTMLTRLLEWNRSPIVVI